jgi:hypothetical protein
MSKIKIMLGAAILSLGFSSIASAATILFRNLSSQSITDYYIALTRYDQQTTNNSDIKITFDNLSKNRNLADYNTFEGERPFGNILDDALDYYDHVTKFGQSIRSGVNKIQYAGIRIKDDSNAIMLVYLTNSHYKITDADIIIVNIINSNDDKKYGVDCDGAKFCGFIEKVGSKKAAI